MKKQICIIILLVACRICNAQTPDWEWARSAACQDSFGIGEGWNIASDALGNVYVTGKFQDSLITFDLITLYNPNSSSDIFIAKYNSTGSVLWAKNAGGYSSGEAYGITTDDFGNVYVTGNFNGSFITFDSDTLNSSGGVNMFLVKFDSSGNVLWARSGNATTIGSGGQSVITDTSGNVYITGGGPLFIAKYDSSGNLLWVKQTNGNINKSSSITTDESGSAYITGFFGNSYLIFDSDTLINSGSTNLFIVKYDSSGNVVWAKSSGGSLSDYGTSITANFSNNIYVAGYFYSPSITFGTVTLLNPGGWRSFLVKIDSSGNTLWAKIFIGALPYSIVSDSADKIFIDGELFGQGIFDTLIILPPAGSNHPTFIVKCDSSGNAEWAKALASGAYQSGAYHNTGIAPGINGSIYVNGNFKNINPFIVGNDTLIPACIENIFVAKLSYTSSTDIPEINNNNNKEIILFPNPFSSELNVLNNEKESEITLYDILSRKLLQQKFTNSVSLITEQLAKGLYLYEVRNNDGSCKNGKVVKD